ncbi:hypothetical protein AM501_12870 [Aneurinibacillus migulanus]|nr:hypothetical protein TS64_27145 [Aneurinibacillus migulanus]KPD07899.1 hypothetical protein AM501_12870 [Aneurinibacillus migulanus]
MINDICLDFQDKNVRHESGTLFEDKQRGRSEEGWPFVMYVDFLDRCKTVFFVYTVLIYIIKNACYF